MQPITAAIRKEMAALELTEPQFHAIDNVLANWGEESDDEVILFLTGQAVRPALIRQVVALRDKARTIPVPLLTIAGGALDVESAL